LALLRHAKKIAFDELQSLGNTVSNGREYVSQIPKSPKTQGTPVTVQQRAMRHGDIRVTMNYVDAVGDGLREASAKVAAKAIPQ
jgi:hypothetical protein